jgi:hypothetical protein
MFAPILHSGLEVWREVESRQLLLSLEIEVQLSVCKFMTFDSQSTMCSKIGGRYKGKLYLSYKVIRNSLEPHYCSVDWLDDLLMSQSVCKLHGRFLPCPVPRV